MKRYWPLGLIACVGFLYVCSKVWQTNDALDFRLFWLSGKLWLSGQNPYSGDLLNSYQDYFESHNTLWVYPLYWFPISSALGILPFTVAFIVWKILNVIFLILATHLTARAFTNERNYWLIFLLGLSYACFMQSTVATLSIGQTSIIVYFGLAAMISGLLKNRPVHLILGLAVLALKPNFGLVAFAVTACQSRFRWTIIPAGLICLVSVIPILFTGHLFEEISGLLSNLAKYSSDFSANEPGNLTGLVHLLRLEDPKILNIAYVLIVFFYFNIKPFNTQTAALFISSMLFILPLHEYDAVAIAIVLMWLVSAPISDGRWLIAAGLSICLRPGNLASATGIISSWNNGFPGNLLLTLGFLLTFMGTIISIVRPSKLYLSTSPQESHSILSSKSQ